MADDFISEKFRVLFVQSQAVVFSVFVPLFQTDNQINILGLLYTLNTVQSLDVDDTDTAQLDEMAGNLRRSSTSVSSLTL